jgi:Xaa-Pro aminopeptidase
MIRLISRSDSFSADFFHKTGFDIDHAVLVESGKDKSLYASRMNLDLARRHWKAARPLDMKRLGKLLRNKEVGMSLKAESASFYDFARKHARKVVDIGDELLRERSMKTDKEVSCIRKAARKSLEIINNVNYSKGKTELQVAKELKMEALEQGLELAYEPIVATGINSSFPHSVPTKLRLKGHVLVDFGVKIENYCGDISETVLLDRKGKAAVLYGKTKEAFSMVVDGLGEAETGNDVYLLYRKAFKALGLPEMPHAIGHGIGLAVHEFPVLKKGSAHDIRGTAFALEPAVYIKGRFGVRFERDILVKKSGKVEIL